jgi:hypothetical protein
MSLNNFFFGPSLMPGGPSQHPDRASTDDVLYRQNVERTLKEAVGKAAISVLEGAPEHKLYFRWNVVLMPMTRQNLTLRRLEARLAPQEAPSSSAAAARMCDSFACHSFFVSLSESRSPKKTGLRPRIPRQLLRLSLRAPITTRSRPRIILCA